MTSSLRNGISCTAVIAEHLVASIAHILKLPNRRDDALIPSGWVDLLVDGRQHRANFVKVAVNVVTLPGSDENVLAEILRDWFGPNAGQLGSRFQVLIDSSEGGWTMKPVRAET